MKRAFAVTLVLVFAGAAEVAAQEGGTPNNLVVRSFQCAPLGAAMQYVQEWRPIAQQMVEEGHFVDYGVLTHAWGDEWNLVDYFVVEDMGRFFDSFDELVRRIGEANRARREQNPDQPTRRPFGEICTGHKDNIYNIVAPPTGG